MKRILAALAALAVASVGVIGLSGAAAATECTPSDFVPAVADTFKDVPNPNYVPAIPGTDAVPAKWWNWSPNKDQGPFDGPPAFPTDERGTWQGPHTNGGPDGIGTFNASNNDKGRSSWFHREPGTDAVPEKSAVGTPTIQVIDVPGTPEIPAVVCNTEPVIVTEWHTWASPTWVEGLNGKGSANDIGWNQTYVGPGQIAPEGCELTYQQDKYTGTREQIDAVLADNILTGPNPPEDQHIVKDWTFVSTDECPPEVPEQPEPRVITETWTDSECVEPNNGVATVTTYGRDTTFPVSFDTESWTWVEGGGVVGETYVIGTQEVDSENCVVPPSTCDDFNTQAEAQAAYEAGAVWLDGDGDGLACETRPTPTPAPSPSASETPVVTQVTGGPTLAATGSNVLPGIAIALILVMVGAAIVVVVGTRR